MRNLFAAAVLFAAVASAATASPAPKAAPAASYFNLSPVALPVVVDGQVVNYVFVTVQIDLAPSADADALRAKEPYFRDALVRDAHRAPFTVATDYTVIDEAKLCATLLPQARAIAGPGAITAVQVMQQTPKSTRVSTGH